MADAFEPQRGDILVLHAPEPTYLERTVADVLDYLAMKSGITIVLCRPGEDVADFDPSLASEIDRRHAERLSVWEANKRFIRDQLDERIDRLLRPDFWAKIDSTLRRAGIRRG